MVEVCSFKSEEVIDILAKHYHNLLKYKSSDFIVTWSYFTFFSVISTIFDLQTSTKAQKIRKRMVQNAVYSDNQICSPIYLLKCQKPQKSEK